MGPFFLVSVSVLFSVFSRVFAVGCVISFSCCAFWVPFWVWVLGAVVLFFFSGFLGVFLLVCSLLFGALNRDHNSTRRPPDREERTKFALGEGKKREILDGPAEGDTAEGGPAEGGPAEGGPWV